MNEVLATAMADAAEGIRLRQVWIALASEDIEDQHKRTSLGPLWLLINYLAFTGAFVFLFHPSGTVTYPAYTALGLLVWFYIMEVITQSVTLFVREESFIKGTRLPMSVYAMRLAMQSIIRAAYAVVGCIIILVAIGTPITWMWLWSGVSLLLVLATTPPVIMIFAFIGAYFPDSRFIISNVMRLGMFITPTAWIYDGHGGIRGLFYSYNPFTYVLEIVRVPIISGILPLRSLLLCIVISLAIWLVAVVLLGRLRNQVVFVL